MAYEYIFDRDRCWYRGACPLENDPEKCRCSCVRFMEMDYLFYSSEMPKALQNPKNLVLYPDDEDLKAFRRLKEIKDNIVEWVEQGNNLFIGSEICGNGKTTWAAKLMNRYFDQIWSGNCFKDRGYFINVSDLLFEFKLSINSNKNMDRWRSRFAEVDLVIWDDLGDDVLTPYEHQILYSIINRRIANGKANIFTSNRLDENLQTSIGGKLYSRVFNNSEIIELLGDDKRGTN